MIRNPIKKTVTEGISFFIASVRSTFKTALLLFVSAAISNAQTISGIEIAGNKHFSASDYAGWIKISAGSKIFKGIEDTIHIRISKGLKENGFYNFSLGAINFTKTDSLHTSALVQVKENEPTLINKIIINNLSEDSLQIKTVLTDLEKAPLSNFNLDYTFSKIISYYENSGFPFASVNIHSVQFIDSSGSDNRFANIFITIDKGKESKIDKIEITGNEHTKDYVIFRSIGMKRGDNYSQRKIDLIPEQLNRLRFFEPVPEPQFYFTRRNEGVLKISVTEKQTNMFDGILGYVPAVNDKESGFLTGFINISMRNLFGTGRAAAFRWQQENRSSQELEIQYMEPWLFDYPFNIEGRLFQRKQDSTYVQRDLEGRFEYMATGEISASVLVNSQSTIPSENSSGRFTVYNSTSLTTGVNFKVDTRDDFYSPTSGIFFTNTYKYTSKKINAPAALINNSVNTDLTLQRLEFDLSFFQRIVSNQVVSLGVHGRELRGSSFEISDLYFLGGTNSLRGYREKQFQGNRILWSNLEYRLLLSARSFAFLFFYTGYFQRNEDQGRNIQGFSQFLPGYGFGLNIETGLGVLSVSFALGKGDSFGDGKIHFGILNEF